MSRALMKAGGAEREKEGGGGALQHAPGHNHTQSQDSMAVKRNKGKKNSSQTVYFFPPIVLKKKAVTGETETNICI